MKKEKTYHRYLFYGIKTGLLVEATKECCRFWINGLYFSESGWKDLGLVKIGYIGRLGEK